MEIGRTEVKCPVEGCDYSTFFSASVDDAKVTNPPALVVEMLLRNEHPNHEK